MKLSVASSDLKRPQAVVFDLDGTLIDSREDIAAACNHALVAVGRAALATDVVARFVGDGARLLVARAMGLPADDAEVDRALGFFHPYYEAHAVVHTTLMPGARELFDALGDRPLAIATNKPRKTTLLCLEALGIMSRFVAIRAGGDGPLKPNARAVLDVLESMRVEPARAWMVGDGEQDVLAGRAAGCVTVGVRGGFQADERLEAARPDLLLASLRDLIPLVTMG